MIARTAVGIWGVPQFGFAAACLASPLAWALADCFLIPAYYGCLNARRRQAARVLSLIHILHVNEKIVEKLVWDYLPFIATENLMMAAVKRGGDRQQLHEIIRRHLSLIHISWTAVRSSATG